MFSIGFKKGNNLSDFPLKYNVTYFFWINLTIYHFATVNMNDLAGNE